MSDSERLATDLRAAATRLARARRVVVYSGAGVSKESGISTFRDPSEGLWAKYDPMALATAEAYARDPAFVWRWYMDRFGLIEQAAPNPGHHALAELERFVPLTVVTVMVVEPLPTTVVGLKLAVAPVGRPETLKPTVPLKPFTEVTVRV